MQADYLGASGFGLSALLLAILSLLIFIRRDSAPAFSLLLVATVTSTIWAGVWLSVKLTLMEPGLPAYIADWARAVAWFAAMVLILRSLGAHADKRSLFSPFGLIVVVLIVVPVAYFAINRDVSGELFAWIAGGYALSLLPILIAEQVFRRAPPELRSSTTYLCIAVAGFFFFDLVLFIAAIAGASPNSDLLAARGYVCAILTLPLLLGVWRRSESVSEGRLSRPIVLYSFSATALALYALLVIVGYRYVRDYGGTWGAVISIVLLAAAVIAVVVLLASASLRSRVRVALLKTFFQYKYDYREEWLRFIGTLSKSGFEDVSTTVVRAVAQIVNSPGGVLFVAESDDAGYTPSGAWQASLPGVAEISTKSGLVQFLVARQWVIDLEELRQYPSRYEGLELNAWLVEDQKWWLVVPVFLGRRLLGFIVLLRARIAPSLNFEDHDLLKTVGRHVGMHINQAESDRRLAESRQFGAYNRLTAFLMHDLNNLIAQQSLVVSNAERFRDNPEFVDDAIDTIANSVARMRALMEQLSRGSKAPKNQRIDLQELIRKVVLSCANRNPIPTLTEQERAVYVNADPERIASVFEHLIRNAQDATPPAGTVTISLSGDREFVTVLIADTGVGMDQSFIRDRLFRPFESTKGSGSMGIGAYQAREYVKLLGGQLEVSSNLGVGTTFSVRLAKVD